MRIFNLLGQNETVRNFKDLISQWKCNIWGKWHKGSVCEKKKRKNNFFSRIADYYFYFFEIIKNN